jgi:putative SOS response-associated peptidase YedK
MLTTEPGPDIAPHHDRQIVILERSALADWLNPSISAKSIIMPLPAGVLHVEQVG